MNAKHSQDEETSSKGRDDSGVMVSRRRFTRAGLSGSVVLGSLASKPVLGATINHCTVSGQISGNLSRPADLPGCAVGKSPEEWLAEGTWPEGFNKGILPDEKCKFGGNDQDKGIAFNGFTEGDTLQDTFFIESVGQGDNETCSFTLSPTTKKFEDATMHQVLAERGESLVASNPYLGAVVVASLLNVADWGVRYPVTMHTIIAMFNAVLGGGAYQVTASKSWDRERVVKYLESLYADAS